MGFRGGIFLFESAHKVIEDIPWKGPSDSEMVPLKLEIAKVGFRRMPITPYVHTQLSELQDCSGAVFFLFWIHFFSTICCPAEALAAVSEVASTDTFLLCHTGRKPVWKERAVSLCETTKMQRENLFARLTGLIFYSTQLIACFLCAATHGNTNSPWLLLLWSGPGLCSDLLFPMTEVDDGNTEYYFLWSTAPAVWHSHIFYVPAVCPCRDRARPHERGGVFRVWKFTDWVPFQPRRSGLQPRGGRGSQV